MGTDFTRSWCPPETNHLFHSGRTMQMHSGDPALCPQPVMARGWRGFGGVLPNPSGREELGKSLRISSWGWFPSKHNLFTKSFLFLPVRFAKDPRRWEEPLAAVKSNWSKAAPHDDWDSENPFCYLHCGGGKHVSQILMLFLVLMSC